MSHASTNVDLTTRNKEPSKSNNNPFGDLWSAKDRNQFELNGDDAKPASVRSNTLERYFVRSDPPPAAASLPNNPSILPQQTTLQQNNQQLLQHPWTQRLYHHLHNTFHISAFRDHQLSIINATLSQRDVFVIMRTGGGKSLTYQLPALLEMESSQKITVVISPLISLIRDQEEQMNQLYRGSAVSFTSGMGKEEHSQRWARVRDGNGGVALVFVTPEKVGKSGKFKGEMEKLWNAGRLGRFVIGELFFWVG
jgi:superfamily II DNA helicase RecQ